MARADERGLGGCAPLAASLGLPPRPEGYACDLEAAPPPHERLEVATVALG